MNHIMNRIPQKQNEPKFLEYLAAASSLYGRAKLITGVQFIITVPIPITLYLLSVIFPDLRPIPTIYGMVVSLGDILFLDQIQLKLKKEAAKVQEVFDCELLEMDWRDLFVGSKPIYENIVREAAEFLTHEERRSKIRDWYSNSVGRLPISIARIICQRSNIWFDDLLRSYYTKWLCIILSIIITIPLVIAICLNSGIKTFILSVALPLSPTVIWITREFLRQRRSIYLLRSMEHHINKIFEDAIIGKLSDVELASKSREFQDQLFQHRHTNQPIFNWLYNRLRSKLDNIMNETSEQLVKRAIETMKLQ